jgi:predicted lysophospholipase L1 biosynthesis ABC-type transport system permease subunit
MSNSEFFLAIALGVFVAVLYPVLYGHIRRLFPATAAPGLPPWVKKYAALFVFSLLTALIVLGFYRSANPNTAVTFWNALAMGFGWEAAVEKIVVPKP